MEIDIEKIKNRNISFKELEEAQEIYQENYLDLSSRVYLVSKYIDTPIKTVEQFDAQIVRGLLMEIVELLNFRIYRSPIVENFIKECEIGEYDPIEDRSEILDI